jgi:predicted SAM-dependent methyltransferase
MRLNLGCQNANPGDIPGFETVDIENAKYISDISLHFSQWGEITSFFGKCDEILASHVLEHFPREKGKVFLSGCQKLLKPGGVLYIAVSDFDLFADCKTTSFVDNYYRQNLNHSLSGDNKEALKYKYMYCQASLSWTLQELGFITIVRDQFSAIHNPNHRAISLYMKAQAPLLVTSDGPN